MASFIVTCLASWLVQVLSLIVLIGGTVHGMRGFGTPGFDGMIHVATCAFGVPALVMALCISGSVIETGDFPPFVRRLSTAHCQRSSVCESTLSIPAMHRQRELENSEIAASDLSLRERVHE